MFLLFNAFFVNIFIFTIYIAFLENILNLKEKYRNGKYFKNKKIKIFNFQIEKYFLLYGGIVLICASIFVFLSYLSISGYISILNKLFIYIFSHILILTIFEGGVFEKFSYYVIYFSTLLACESVPSVIAAIYTGNTLSTLEENQVLYVTITYFEELGVALILFLITKHIKDVGKYISIPTQKYFRATLICSAVFIMLISKVLLQMENSSYYWIAAVAIIFVLSYSILSDLILKTTIKNTIKNTLMLDNLILVQSQLESYENYKELVEDYFLETKKFRHDLSNNMILLKSMIEDGKYDLAIDILKSYEEDIEAVISPVETGNMVLDFVLNQKYTLSQSKNVNLKYNINLVDKLNIKQNHIIALLFNLIDNSIDSASETTEKFVCVTILCRNGILSIKTENSATDGKKALNYIEDKKSSKKVEKSNHGVGLNIISAIVEKYNGSMQVSVNDKGNIEFDILLHNVFLENLIISLLSYCFSYSIQ